MSSQWVIIITFLILCVAVFLLRIAAGRPNRPLRNDIPDLIVGLTLWFSTALMTLKPASSALFWATLAGGLAIADHTKRKVLREPVVFADVAELLQLFRHPHFYLPFVPRLLFYGAGFILFICTALLFLIEPTFFSGRHLWVRFCGMLLIALPIIGYFHQATLQNMVRIARLFKPSCDAFQDAHNLGLLGSFAAHTVISREERPERRRLAYFGPVTTSAYLPPLLIVQAESFFDPQRLFPAAHDLLPYYNLCKQNSWRHGRLQVDTWGGNTVRSEFSCITGLSEEKLGLDRFNPYHSFAKRRIDSLAWQLRDAGYQTVCVHPYARNFYSRNKVMSNLGFERFIGAEAFSNPIGRFISDIVLADWINKFIKHQTRPTFVFAITVANHGPWENTTSMQKSQELYNYFDGLRQTDNMIKCLLESDWLNQKKGVFTFYGDHQPSLKSYSREYDATDTTTDYFIFDLKTPKGIKKDIPISKLGHLLASHLAHFVDFH